MSTGEGLGGRGPARPDHCFCPGRCGARPGHRGPIAVLQPMPGVRAPGPALDLTPALPVAGGWAPLPRRRFQTLPHSQPPQARGAAPGHDPPVGPPQSRAGAGSSGLEGEGQRGLRGSGRAPPCCPEASLDRALSLSGPPLATGISAHRDRHESASPRAGIATPWHCPTGHLPWRWGPLSECLLCPTAITSSRAFPHGPPALGPRDPQPRSGAAAPMAASAAAVSSSSEDTLICLLGRRLPPCPRFGFNP